MSVVRLFDTLGHGIALEILGYEFPELEDVPYDSNWLQVRLDVRYPEDCWQGVDPCLLTYEARQLADWLERVAYAPQAEDEVRFIEPLIAFRVLDSCHVRLEFWHPDEDRDYQVDLVLDELDLVTAARDLRTVLASYPQRTER